MLLGAGSVQVCTAVMHYGYRIVDRLFASRVVPRGAVPRELPRGIEIRPVYDAGGAAAGVAEFMDRNTVARVLPFGT